MLRTSLIRHEIFCLVFAVVETAGQNHIIIGTLRKNRKLSHWKTVQTFDVSSNVSNTASQQKKPNLNLKPNYQKVIKHTLGCIYLGSHLLSRGVFTAEGNRLQLISSACQCSEARFPGFESFLKESHCQPGLLLHGPHMGRSNIIVATTASAAPSWPHQSTEVVLAFSQAI